MMMMTETGPRRRHAKVKLAQSWNPFRNLHEPPDACKKKVQKLKGEGRAWRKKERYKHSSCDINPVINQWQPSNSRQSWQGPLPLAVEKETPMWTWLEKGIDRPRPGQAMPGHARPGCLSFGPRRWPIAVHLSSIFVVSGLCHVRCATFRASVPT